MEGLSPPLKCLIEIHCALSNGETVRTGLGRFLQSARARDSLASSIRRFLFAWEQGQDWKSVINGINSPYRRALLEIVANALAGQPILAHIEELKDELISATEAEISRHIEILPIKMLIPLLLFQFPAFLILLFGPLLSCLIEEVNR